MKQASSFTSGEARPRTLLGGLVAAARPQQWVKNVLVGAAPLAAGALTEGDVIAASLLAFVVFCLAASGVYLLNDAMDVESDRSHPTKRFRPIAAGVVPVPTAVGVGAVLLVVALALSAALGTAGLTAVMGTYVVLQIAYSLRLKHERVVDLAIVSSGFLLRAMAGGLAADLPLSRWFLIVAAFGSLFMVAGKRYSELVLLGDDAARARPSLAGYSRSYLRFVWSIAAAVTIGAYCLGAFGVGDRSGGEVWAPISVAPFVVGLLRYALDIDSGNAGAPEEIVLRDRVLQAVGLIWLVFFALGAFGASQS